MGKAREKIAPPPVQPATKQGEQGAQVIFHFILFSLEA